MSIIKNISLPDLGIGACMVAWGFRASAAGHSNCSVLVKSFDHALGSSGQMALGALRALSAEIGFDGNRKVSLCAPGCCHVSADELSLISCVSAAQSGEEAQAHAHLTWLLAKSHTEEASRIAHLVGRSFSHAGMTIHKPDIEISQPDTSLQSPPQHPSPTLH